YKNSSVLCLPDSTFRQLQLIQNVAFRVLTRIRKAQNTTLILRSLCWLPVKHRIDFKVLLLVFKSISGSGPNDISNMLTQYEPTRTLHSSGTGLLTILRMNTKQSLVIMVPICGTNYLSV
ncbi:hypothetical protein LDENG_00143080, partial [Lucifuga dentata]